MAVTIPPSVDSVIQQLRDLLQRARQIKQSQDILPPLSSTELLGGNTSLFDVEASNAKFYIIETAARQVFHDILESTSIKDANFVGMWNMLDILQIGADLEECDPVLALYLVEELLDSQSINGCRKVFDYLESRRENMVTRNFTKNKSLVVLRACNELLRRLSRAEDTVFCGRVFIFLFQSFPLGDRSAVNLRGEFHVENVTTFEETSKTGSSDTDAMDVDLAATKEEKDTPKDNKAAPTGPSDDTAKPSIESQKQALDTDALYPIFWKLQQAFSDPPSLFNDQSRLNEFKGGLKETLLKFKQVPKVQQARKAELNKGVKRKYDEHADDFLSTFNPKYLTSRDLFKLELSDLDFQRYFLLQAWILIEFLLSLTASAREQITQMGIQVQVKLRYDDFTLSEEDAKWATSARQEIKDYITSGHDAEEKGRFFLRMVETILFRDQNWVKWKMESCPSIAREPVTAADFFTAKTKVQEVCAPRRMKNNYMTGLDLAFLSEEETMYGLEKLKDASRFAVEDEESLIRGIESHELDLDFASDEQRRKLQESMASKTWKTLRIASRKKLSCFDKIEDTKNLKVLLSSSDSRPTGKDEEMAAPSDEPMNGPRAETQVKEQTEVK